MKNQIKIESIALVNFKGAKNQEINFTDQTNIFGDNGTGKTTIFDAFTWLLFGKDSSDRKDFEVKHLDSQNKKTDNAEIEVSAVLDVNGTRIEVKRILKENWVKKRGSLEPEFKGNETVYYWDGVPMQQKEYLAKITAILDESVFKLITNPLAFNSLKWQDKRNVLIEITGSISNEALAGSNPEYIALVEKLTGGKSLDDYRKQISASIKKSKDDLKDIPTRVDEILRSKPEGKDFEAIRSQISFKEQELKGVDELIQNKSAAFDAELDKNSKKKLHARSLRDDIETIERTAKSEAKAKVKPDDSTLMLMQNTLESKTHDLQSANNNLNTLESKEATLKNEISQTDAKIAGKRADWEAENAKELVFDDSSFCCPTCQTEFSESKIETQKEDMLSKFRTAKQVSLNSITSQGQSLANEKANLEKEHSAILARIETGKGIIANLKAEIEKAKTDIEAESKKYENIGDLPSEETVCNEILAGIREYANKKAELKMVEDSIADIPTVDIEDLKSQRSQVIYETDLLKKELQEENQIKAVENRISELREEESKLAQFIANVEKEQFTIENFNKLRIDSLESNINSKFSYVKFKLFDTQINGGEVECCDALINGVPFSDANTASKINAGLDIINTLCEHYKVSAPIFIDNKESVVEVIGTESQIINLIVSEKDKTLRVA